MIWLVAMGVSRHHGSELLVGWQWLSRLRSAGTVTAFVSKVFEDKRYLNPSDCFGIRFVDTRPANPEEINTRHLQHTYRFWKQVRRELQRDARPGDRLVIVSPSAIWFLPYLWGLPFQREDVFYGPIGAVRLSDASMPRSLFAIMRDLLTYCVCIAWRVFSNWLPRRLSLRYPCPWFLSMAGRNFNLCATLPEVEISEPKFSKKSHELAPGPIALLYDERLRKNFEVSLKYSLKLAAAENRSLVLIGAPLALKSRLEHISNYKSPLLKFYDRMPRECFVTWLQQERPTLVNLSLSEGVPSILIEALAAGCDVHVYAVGGITWLIEFAASHQTLEDLPRTVDVVSWNDDSIARYQGYVTDSFNKLLKDILAPREGDRLC